MQTSFDRLSLESMVLVLSSYSKEKLTELTTVRPVDEKVNAIATALLLLWDDEEKLKIFKAFNSQQLSSLYVEMFEGKEIQPIEIGNLQQKEKLISNMEKIRLATLPMMVIDWSQKLEEQIKLFQTQGETLKRLRAEVASLKQTWESGSDKKKRKH